MKVYTAYSDSHKVLYDDFFIQTLPNDLSVIPYQIKQTCPSGSYYDSGWSTTCYQKTQVFLQACEENKNDIFLFSDVDVQFFTKNIVSYLIQELADYDIACQDDGGSYCSGFFICKSNDNTLNMFNNINKQFANDDQYSLNQYIRNCKHKTLSRRFFTVHHSIGRVWNRESDNFSIPNDILVHHANWTVGVENKIKLLNIVRNKYDELSNTLK